MTKCKLTKWIRILHIKKGAIFWTMENRSTRRHFRWLAHPAMRKLLDSRWRWSRHHLTVPRAVPQGKEDHCRISIRNVNLLIIILLLILIDDWRRWKLLPVRYAGFVDNERQIINDKRSSAAKPEQARPPPPLRRRRRLGSIINKKKKKKIQLLLPSRRSKVIHYPNEFSSPSNHPTSRLPLTWWITNENGRVEYQLTAAGESTFLQTSFSLRCRTAQTAEETLFL